MQNSEQNRSSGNQPPLTQWLYQVLGQRGWSIQLQLRGNHLLILCEGEHCPNQMFLLNRLLPALHKVDINTLLPAEHPHLYQVLLYGRQCGQERPSWTSRIQLNQLAYHLEQLQQARIAQRSRPVKSGNTATLEPLAAMPTKATESALALSNRSQAKQGQPDAIARYLSETISRLGIAVNVSVKTITHPAIPTPAGFLTATSSDLAVRRLWIVCEAVYSPDPLLIGEPLAQQLRDLELEGFKDAVILIQVRGEASPDWVLRVDLTPDTEILRELARWGDVEAITALLRKTLADQSIQLTTSILKESTLHLSCSALSESLSTLSATSKAPERETVRSLVAPILETLGPQGIHAAALYGQIEQQEAPAWVDWLELPAAQHPMLADPPLILSQRGDQEAIAFLLTRLLNPDLNKLLATGGIRVQLLLKQDLLHVMTDAPVCPDQQQVSKSVISLLKQLKLAGVAGVRIYGRRAGQKRPLWSYGGDFTPRQRLVPEPTPEFAATDAYVNELVAQPGELIVRPDLTPDDLHNVWNQVRRALVMGVRTGLVRSQLCIPISEAAPELSDEPANPSTVSRYQGAKIALIWGAVGLLLTFQLDRGLAQLLKSMPVEPVIGVNSTSPPAIAAEPPTSDPLSSPSPSINAKPKNSTTPFTTDPFIQFKDTSPEAATSTTATQANNPFRSAAPPPQNLIKTIDLAAKSPYPTFNSQQLDAKIALYQQQWSDSGPVDVLILGSSRALRGVDPTVLKQQLAALGYPNVSVFNFGVNGATAQVVDLIVRRLLAPKQLPRLIIWADGARAFNSGTTDVTYNGIATSEGYRELNAGNLPSLANSTGAGGALPAAANDGGIGNALTLSYDRMDRWFSAHLARLSGVYTNRDRLKAVLQDQSKGLLSTLPLPHPSQTSSAGLVLDDQDGFDLNGFLPLSVRFNPATYYQQYARVSGQYDSDYENFQIEGRQAEALRSLLEFTRSQSIPVVFVNLPMTDIYLDPVRQRYEQAFKQYMLQVSVQQQGLIFRDLDDLWQEGYDFFSDPSHLNRYGAYEVSRRLAQDPMIPWAKPTLPRNR
jgi:hypothetical protein